MRNENNWACVRCGESLSDLTAAVFEGRVVCKFLPDCVERQRARHAATVGHKFTFRNRRQLRKKAA
jgi:hypothetical protein